MSNLAFNVNFRAILGLYLLALVSPTSAQGQGPGETLFDVYRLASEVSVDVDNDLMVVTLAVQEEDKDATVLANRVNVTMSWAVNELQSYNTISVKTRDYQTFPRYENLSGRRLIGWRALQSLELETDDFAAVGKAIQVLQERLKVQSINLSVKPATREKASDLLIENALNSFKDRALLIQQNMNSSGYRILDVDINTEQTSPGQGGARMMMAEDSAYRSVESAPAIVGGSTTVYVRINGRIQLD